MTTMTSRNLFPKLMIALMLLSVLTLFGLIVLWSTPTRKEERLLEQMPGRNVEDMRDDLYLEPTAHGHKHDDQLLPPLTVMRLLQAHTCVASRRYYAQDNSGREFYLCRDPATGQLGGIFVNPDGKTTGYGTSEDWKFIRKIVEVDAKWFEYPSDWTLQKYLEELVRKYGWRTIP